MDEAVECENLTHEKYDVAGQLKAFVEAGGELLACGTCHLSMCKTCYRYRRHLQIIHTLQLKIAPDFDLLARDTTENLSNESKERINAFLIQKHRNI